MATKSYSKHKEYKEFSSSTKGSVPAYTDEQFDMIKSELLPKGSKLETLGRNGVGGTREYHYEYKEEKHPSGKYDRKDLHTVEEYTIPPKTVPKESSAYYYEREERELPALTGTRTYNYETTATTPGYSKVKSSKVTKDMTQNVEELDSLLDDLQRDQERQLYKSGYTSDTAESTSFDYRKGTPVKAPSSGYSTLKREERLESSSWSGPPPPVTRQAEVRQEIYREEKTESRVVPSQVSPALPLPVPAPVCAHCHNPPTVGTLSRSGTPMNKVTTIVKTYTYEVPAGQDPTTVPIPVTADHSATYTSEEHVKNNTCVTGAGGTPGCQHCPHCNTRLRDYRSTLRTDEHTSERTSERMLYPAPANETKLLPENGHPPYGPTGTSYKYSETSYSTQNTSQRFPSSSPSGPSPAPFPRPHTPSGTQQPPKKLDDLLADFPEARFPTQTDGLVQRKVETKVEGLEGRRAVASSGSAPGPAVYYPPGHTPFQKKDPEPAGYQSSAMVAGGGAYASGRGAYEYEAGARSKEKHSEKKTAVPVCLPLCCAMPCVIM